VSEAPDPRAFEQIARQAVELLTHDRCGQPDPSTGQPRPSCLMCLYRWAYHAGLGGTVSEEAKVQSDSSDPTSAIVGSKFQLRSACRTSFETLRSLPGIERTLERALGKAYSRHGVEVKTSKDQSLVTGEERAQAMAAKQRREARGQGWGEG
jgi:hypothetical protein